MMGDDIAAPLLTALAQEAALRLPADHPLLGACRRADVAGARAELSALAPDVGDALLAGAHRRLREDPARWLARWRPPTAQ